MSASNSGRYLGGYEPEVVSRQKSGGGQSSGGDSGDMLRKLMDALNEKKDEDTKFRRTLEDLLNNLEFENMPAVQQYINELKKQTENSLAAINIQADANSALIELIAQWQNETDSSLAYLKLQADENGSQIQLLAEWRGEAETSLASIEQRVTANEANIDSVVIWKGTASTSIAAVQQKASANESSITGLTQWKGTVDASIGLLGSNYTQISQQTTQNSANITLMTSSGLFTDNGNGTSSVNASVVLATFTDYNSSTGKYQLKSNISLAADTIDLSGYVTFTNLSTAGQTVINGGNLMNESISTDKLTSSNNQIIFSKHLMFNNANYSEIGQVSNISFRNSVTLFASTAGYRQINFQNADFLFVNGQPVLHSGNYSDYVSTTARFG